MKLWLGQLGLGASELISFTWTNCKSGKYLLMTHEYQLSDKISFISKIQSLCLILCISNSWKPMYCSRINPTYFWWWDKLEPQKETCLGFEPRDPLTAVTVLSIMSDCADFFQCSYTCGCLPWTKHDYFSPLKSLGILITLKFFMRV